MNICVCLSGSGRSLANLLEHQKNASWSVKLVISSSASCKGIDVAKRAGIQVMTFDFSSKSSQEQSIKLSTKIQSVFDEHKISLVVLAGFLKKFPKIADFEGKVINIHPALLPKYGGKGMYGMNVHQAVHKAREEVSGATVHFVNAAYDEGAVISQIQVKILQKYSPEEIANKVFEAECVLLPKTIDALLTGELPLQNGKVKEMKMPHG
jgi:phosphoribosylglycinamide formyltransferase-1